MSTRTIDIDERVLPRPARRPHRGARTLLAAMVALGIAVPIFAGLVTLPVQSVRISGEFVRVSKSDIERAVAPMLARGLIGIDLDALRHAALEVPGVRDATVRRAWPDSVEIWVVERVAAARWAGGGYLEIDGTHFVPPGDAADESLPLLTGPHGSQQRVLDLHIALDRVLAPLGMPIRSTELTPRGVLYATLHDGPQLVMRPDVAEQDVQVYARTLAKAMAGRVREIARVDFRYPTGFAVRMRSDRADSETSG